jgi:hypothetical protein
MLFVRSSGLTVVIKNFLESGGQTGSLRRLRQGSRAPTGLGSFGGADPGLRARGALHPGLTSFAPTGHFGGSADGAEGVPFQNIFVDAARGVSFQNIFVDAARGVPFQNIFADGAEGVRLKTSGVQRNGFTAECLMNADGAGAGFNSNCGAAAGDFA